MRVGMFVLLATVGWSQVKLCDMYTGSDAGVKINKCIADLPSGGIADARNINGIQSAKDTISLNHPVQLLLGTITLQMASNPGIGCDSIGASVVGLGENQGTGTTLITLSASNDIFAANQPFCRLTGVLMRSSVVRTGGAAVAVKAGATYFDHLRIERTYNGISEQCPGCGGLFSHILMGKGGSTAGNWNTGIIAGGVDSGTVASTHYEDISITGDDAFADAMIVLDSGVDTPLFVNIEAVQGGVDSVVLKMRKTGKGVAPRWVRFTNSVFEAGPTRNALEITAGTDVRIVNSNIATSKIGIHLNGPPGQINGFVWQDGTILNIQENAVLADGATHFEILDSRIADVGLFSSGKYASIAVAPKLRDFRISGNSFASILGSSSRPNYNVLVEFGTSKYIVTNNRFADYSVDGMRDLGTTTKKITSPNLQ